MTINKNLSKNILTLLILASVLFFGIAAADAANRSGKAGGKIKGIFIWDLSPDRYLTHDFFVKLSERGCTHVFMALNEQKDYKSCLKQVTAVQKNMQGTNLELVAYLDVLNKFTPSTAPKFLSQLRDLVCATGVSFSTDDYVVNKNWDPASLKILGRQITETVHSANRNALTYAPYWAGGSGICTRDLAPLFDYIIPELYRRYYEPLKKDHQWVDRCLTDYAKELAGKPNNIIPAFATYDSSDKAPKPIRPYQTTDIYRDVEIAKSKGYGYIYYVWEPWDAFSPDDLKFP